MWRLSIRNDFNMKFYEIVSLSLPKIFANIKKFGNEKFNIFEFWMEFSDHKDSFKLSKKNALEISGR